MAMTFKKRKDGQEKAVFAAYIGLTREEVAVLQRLADAAGNQSCREFVRRIAVKAIKDTIAANK